MSEYVQTGKEYRMDMFERGKFHHIVGMVTFSLSDISTTPPCLTTTLHILQTPPDVLVDDLSDESNRSGGYTGAGDSLPALDILFNDLETLATNLGIHIHSIHHRPEPTVFFGGVNPEPVQGWSITWYDPQVSYVGSLVHSLWYPTLRGCVEGEIERLRGKETK